MAGRWSQRCAPYSKTQFLEIQPRSLPALLAWVVASTNCSRVPEVLNSRLWRTHSTKNRGQLVASDDRARYQRVVGTDETDSRPCRSRVDRRTERLGVVHHLDGHS